ncbi:MFS general substrate transporter [Sanghuangporus baumii]|uniref:MFS general substrate transporter n=1 Tax=Sanghuangporus baumii TaxID=108892 RepID=A0A9Q5I5G8_SANBA|nr:MFS general substrate transporter [Sanghuangporus baumii]
MFPHLDPHKRRSVLEVASTFDFLGLFLLMGGVVLIFIGFQSAQTAAKRWQAPETISILVVGGVLLIAGSINEVYTSRDLIVPPRLFTGTLISFVGLPFFALLLREYSLKRTVEREAKQGKEPDAAATPARPSINKDKTQE